MRILFVGKRYYTNKDALQEHFGRIYQLPMQWRIVGNDVALHLIDYHGTAAVTSVSDGLPVQSHPVRRIGSLQQLRKIGDAFQPDCVVASGDCFIGLLGLHMARRTKSKLVFDIYDDYRTFGGYRLFLGWNAMAFICRRSSLVTYASNFMRDRHHYKCPSSIIPNGIDSILFVPMEMDIARDMLHLSAQGLLVGYFGSMAHEHGVNVLIQAIQSLRSEFPSLRLLICGNPNADTPLDKEWIIYRGLVPHSDIPTYMGACNVLALPYLHSPFLDAASSCKIAEYFACARPVVATRTPNFVDNFPEQARELNMVLSTPGNVDELADSIRRQLVEPVIVELPPQMSWQAIAARAEKSLEIITQTCSKR